MKIEIKLDDPMYCDGCPCLDCFYNCQLFSTSVRTTYRVLVRPQECIEKNGE